jgi:hypothetical protein
VAQGEGPEFKPQYRKKKKKAHEWMESISLYLKNMSWGLVQWEITCLVSLILNTTSAQREPSSRESKEGSSNSLYPFTCFPMKTKGPL